MKTQYAVQDIETGKVEIWNIKQILEEINRDRSSDWTDYNSSDWREGWNEWVDGWTLIGQVRCRRHYNSKNTVK